VLRSFVMHWIGAHVASGDIVAEHDCCLVQGTVELALHSATTLATPRYSASALERETVVCRLEDHEINESPMNTQ
jgi:hypothetical protein